MKGKILAFSFLLLLALLLQFGNVFASVSSLEDFNVLTNLTNNFYDDGSPQFTATSTGGISGTASVNVPLNTTDIWTTKQAYTVSGAGDKYTFSAYFEIASNGGYGGVGFTPDTANTGDGFGSPTHGLGFYFHGGGGGFVNNRATANVAWAPDLVYSPKTWYWLKYEVTALGGNKYDEHFEIWNSDNTGTIGTLKVQGNLNGVTNTDIGSANIIHGYFSAAGSRMDKIDNFQVDLDGNATFVAAGTPVLVGSSVTNVTTTGADSGGNILDDQGNAITDRGICYVAGTGLPSLSDTCTSSGAGSGSFTTSFSGLAPITTYTLRAYATNSQGTSYGAPQVFTTAYNLIKVGGTSFSVVETGANTDTMDIVLTATPTSNVVLNISSSSSTAGTVSPSQITFTPLNWNIAQTITLTAVDNNVLDSARLYNVTIAVDPSSDAAYLAVPSINIPAQTQDDGDIFVELSTTTSSDVEASGGNFVQILINAILSSPATVELVDLLTGSAASGGDYTFTSPQTITIPAGTYDGTLSTAVSISGLTIIDDSILENNKTINFQIQNPFGVKFGDVDGDTSTSLNWTYTIVNDDASSTPTGGGGGGTSSGGGNGTPYPSAYVDAGMVGGANADTQNGTKLNNNLVLKNVTDPDTLTADGHSNIDLITCKPSFPIRAKYNAKNDPVKIVELQKFLNTLDLNATTSSVNLPVTGLFHRTDVDAVKKFEKQNGLPPLGIWGPAEHDIASKISCGWVSPKEAKENQQKIQDELNKKISPSTATTSTPAVAKISNVFQDVMCKKIFANFLQKDLKINSQKDVKALQKFLNQELGLEMMAQGDNLIPVNGQFGPLTEKYVKKFQEKNSIDTTGVWGTLSIKKANQILCGK